MIITFDGHSSVGKTTQAKILSEKLGIPDVNVNSEFTVVERFFGWQIPLLVPDHSPMFYRG